MDESGLKGLEEERRLAYVGITRAEEVCTISFAANRRVYGQWQSQLPSRFVDELPEDHVEVLTAPGLYGGGYGGMSGDYGGSRLEEKASRADAYNSPGWKRMQAQGNLRAKPAPNEAKGLVIDATAVSSFTQGDRVFHTKFGYGTVMGHRRRQAGYRVRQGRCQESRLEVHCASRTSGRRPLLSQKIRPTGIKKTAPLGRRRATPFPIWSDLWEEE